MIERALRASVLELHKAQSGDEKDANEAYQRAIRASVEEAKKVRAETSLGGQETGVEKVGSKSDGTEGHDYELEKALTKSLEDYHASLGQAPANDDRDSGLGTEEDEAYQRTIEESKRSHMENERKLAEIERQQRLIKEEDQELQRALAESQQENKTKEEELQKQRNEEDVVMEYVKKQSLLEEEHRRKKDAESQAT